MTYACGMAEDLQHMFGQHVIASASPWQRRLESVRSIASWLLRTDTLRGYRLTRADWAYMASTFALTRLLIFALGILGSAMIPTVGPRYSWSLQPVTWQTLARWTHIYDRFDSGWYIGISHGYPSPTPGNLESLRIWGFLPGYPIALHLISETLTFLHIPGPVDQIAGVLVSHAALFGGVIYLYRLAAAELDSVAARRATLYLLVFPTSLFLSAIYPEGLLLFATAGAFYHARRRQWVPAGLLAALGVVTHTQGILALIPLTMEFLAFYWQRGGWRQRGMLKLGWLLAPPLAALVAYAIYSHSRTGYWLAFSTSQNMVWGHRLTLPIAPFVGFLLRPGAGSAFDFDFRLVNIAAAVLALALSVVAFRRLPPSYGVAILCGVLLPLATDGSHTHSLARHVGSLFAVFVALAAWSLRQRAATSVADAEAPISPLSSELRDRVVLVPSLLLLALYTLMFTAGIYAAI